MLLYTTAMLDICCYVRQLCWMADQTIQFLSSGKWNLFSCKTFSLSCNPTRLPCKPSIVVNCAAQLLNVQTQISRPFYSQGTANTFLNKYAYQIHNYSTRQGMHLRLPVCRTNWGKQVSSYLFINEWNKLHFNVSPTSTYDNFRSSFWNFYKPL